MNRLPAEWEPQSGVILVWPDDRTDWSCCLEATERACRAVAAEIARREIVLIVCRNDAHRQHVERQLIAEAIDLRQVRCALSAFDDTWVRDYGPVTVLSGEAPVLLNFRFNAWGGKYACEQDDAVVSSVATQGALGGQQVRPVEFVLEGGAIETDGAGTFLATRRSVICEERNPGFDQSAVEAILTEQLGVDRFLWLDHGELSGDDTDGHIDTLVRFCSSDTLCYIDCDDPAHPDYAELDQMRKQLETFSTRDGNAYRLIALPAPPDIRDEDGRRLAASYANFLIVNGAVLAPAYGADEDRTALARLAEAFPQHEIIPIDCRAFIHQNGSLHCMTMQLPESVSL